MRIFLDTANLEEIRHGAKLGVVSGVTTNPSLVAKEEGIRFREAIQEICSIIEGPVSAECVSLDATGLVREAREVSSWAPNVVAKIPMTAAGLEAVSLLSPEGVKTNVTLCFSPNQALLAALAGATYASVFVGRLDDVGHDGMRVVADVTEVFRRYQLSTQLIAASIRHPLHCLEAARAGAPIATVPYKVLMQMIEHPLTHTGIARFLEDWQQVERVR